MRWSTVLGLGLLALLQTAILLIGGQRWRSTDEERLEARRVLPGFDGERVERIVIERRGSPAVELRRDGDGWTLVRPLRDPADTGAVQALLAGTEFLEELRSLPPRVSRAQLGLEPPAVSLSLLSGGSALRLSLGAADPSGKGVYLASGDRVRVVERAYLEVASADIDRLRDPQLVTSSPEGIRRVRLAGDGPGWLLEREGEGWMLEANGRRLPAASARTERLILMLSSLRATRFLPSATAAPPRWVALQSESGEVQLAFGAPCPGWPEEQIVVLRGGRRRAAVCVEREDLLLLVGSPAALEQRALLELEEPQVAGIELQAGSRSLILERNAGAWQLRGGARADDQAVRTYLESLRAVQGSHLTAGPASLAELARGPRGRLTVRPERGDPVTLILGSGRPPRSLGDDFAPILRQGVRGAVLWIPSGAAALFDPEPARFRDHQVMRFRAIDARQVVLISSRSSCELVREAGGWRRVRPEGERGDASQVEPMLQRLSRLRARRFVSEAPTRFGLTVRIVLQADAIAPTDAGPPARELLLQIAEEVGGRGCVGRVAGAPAFELDEADCGAIGSGARAIEGG